MNGTDYVIVLVYIAAFVGMGFLFKNQRDGNEYFLGGKRLGWFPLGLSIMATQMSTISFISAPAFAGYKEGGGLQWLTYGFAVPIAMIFLMTIVIPPLYKSGIVSVYEFLEQRFSKATRLLISLVFMISRSFATGVMVYAVAIMLMATIKIPFWQTIVLIGVTTLIYSLMGGMKAVVYGDAVQMIIIFLGLLVCFWYSLDEVGGWQAFTQAVDKERLEIIDFGSLGLLDGEQFGFWPMLLGGFFLYCSYYGTDQTQVQRSLSASSLDTVRRMLLFNGLLRFPMVLLFCLFGLAVGTVVHQNQELMRLIPADRPDYMVPIFILRYLPHGMIGLLMVAMLSAAMSSLSSAINSLSAVTVEDFIKELSPKALSSKRYLLASRLAALFWGVFCIALAFVSGDIADTVIEAINKVGSLFYGPILATFLLAILSKRTHAVGMNIGIAAGVLVNMVLWVGFQDQVFWFWWNVIGTIITGCLSYLISRLIPYDCKKPVIKFQFDWSMLANRETLILGIYFVLVIMLSLFIPGWLGA